MRNAQEAKGKHDGNVFERVAISHESPRRTETHEQDTHAEVPTPEHTSGGQAPLVWHPECSKWT